MKLGTVLDLKLSRM